MYISLLSLYHINLKCIPLCIYFMTRKYLFHLDVTMVEVTSLTTRIELLTVSAVTVEQMVYYDVVREFYITLKLIHFVVLII